MKNQLFVLKFQGEGVVRPPSKNSKKVLRTGDD